MDQVKIHFIDEDTGVTIYRSMRYFAPSVGDELRFSDEKYYKVTLLVWVYDEPEEKAQRLNIGIKKIEFEQN